VKRIVRWFVGLLVVVRALRRGKPRRAPEPARERIVAPAQPNRSAENLVVVLLLAAAAASAVFVVAYGVGWSTQVLGGALAGALALFAAALLVVGSRLIATEELSEPYPEEDPEAQRDVAQIVRESGEGITRKKLIGGVAGVAGGALGAALIVPAASLGPVFDTSRLNETPWRAGRRLVDEQGRPLRADEIEVGPFYTAFPEGHARSKAIGAPLVLVRLEPAALRLPPDRHGWAPEGILAYSKICTHAGCAVALYRNPKFRPTQPKPALVCPCHYSTFDPADGGSVLFGPAGRPLPQLPLAIGPDRTLRAAGAFSTPPGPSWWGVRNA
jgi:ubiquinol-cytochrome c reductase iron-sulfur subunit